MKFFRIKILYSKNQFNAYFINILEIVLEYYQYWLQWISLDSFEQDGSKWFKLWNIHIQYIVTL